MLLCSSLDEFIQRYQVDAIIWKADKLLTAVDNPIQRNDCFIEIATTIALVPKPSAREDYGKRIGKTYDMSWPTMRKLIEDGIAIQRKKSDIKTNVRKNKVAKLEGDPSTWPFFSEKINKNTGEFQSIEINELKFIQLLQSFGYTRYQSSEEAAGGLSKDRYQFVKLDDNVIRAVSRAQIIDEVEHFILNQYDFTGANCQFVTPDLLINKFYRGMGKLFA